MTASKSIQIHGHRGSRGTHIENTLPGFREAVKAGADFIELDIQLISDQIPIVYHDSLISGRLCYRSTGIVLQPIPVGKLKAEELKNYFCGTYVDPRFPGQKLIPKVRVSTLEEILVWAIQEAPSIGLNIELKTKPNPFAPPPEPKVFTQVVLELIKKYKLEERVLLQSFDMRTIEAIRTLAPEIPVSRLFRVDPECYERTLATNLSKVTIHHSLLTQEKVKRLQNHGLFVLTYTLNTEKSWERVIDMGVNAIITDYPKKLSHYLSKNPRD